MSARIEDTGPGITDMEQAKLFQPFSQIKRGLKAQEGTGLGLAIGRNYARLMGGDVTIISSPGHGSTFLFEIPVERDDAGAGVTQSAPRDVISIRAGTALPGIDPVIALPSDVTPEQLAELPLELIEQLLDAIQEGEKDRLDGLIQRGEESNQQAAGALKAFAENYEYDALTHLLEKTKRELQP